MKGEAIWALAFAGMMFFSAFSGCLFGIGEKNDESDDLITDLPWLDYNGNGVKDLFEDTTKTFWDRASDLVSLMTVDEMMLQMFNNAPAIDRLNIPSYQWWNEALHGYCGPFVEAYTPMGETATVFPISMALASTWNLTLVEKEATAISDEARAIDGMGKDFWCPNVNMNRDPRWGRAEETYGEDTFLTSTFGVAFVKAMQGNDSRYYKTIATPKHYAANNDEAHRHNVSAQIDERLLRNYYSRQFQACIREGGAYSFMGAYNAINGVPCNANKTLMSDIPRNEWDFNGYTTTDCWAPLDIWAPQPIGHGYVPDPASATAAVVNAGVDLFCDIGHELALTSAYYQGLITEERIREAGTRLFEARMKLGQFDPPELDPYSSISKDVVECAAHRELARQVARDGMVLLKNENNVLPFEGIKSIAVIGPTADTTEFGGYSGETTLAISPLVGIQNKAAQLGVEVKYAKGCDLPPGNPTGVIPIVSTGTNMIPLPSIKPPAPLPNEVADLVFSEAIAAAESCDVAIVVVNSGGAEGSNNDYLDLQGLQEDLIRTVARYNPKTVVAINAGCIIMADPWIDSVPGVLQMWYAGEEGGNALADIVFGDCNPSGKMTVTYYKNLDQLPSMYEYDIRKGWTYMYSTETPRYPFGYGLSYTTFGYSNLKMSSNELGEGGKITVSADITNTGERYGQEIAQLYVHDVQRSTNDAPMKELKGFSKVGLQPGETKTVAFEIDPKVLSFYDANMDLVVEPGIYDLMVGASSQDIRLTSSFEITEPILLE